MDYKLLASDLDGTLLNSDGLITPENWKAIEKMKEEGYYFVPSSGRCFSELPPEIRDSDLIRYYILSGGAVIYDKKTDAFEMQPIEKDVKNRILDTLFRYPVCLFSQMGKVSFADSKYHNAAAYASFNMNEYWVQHVLDKEKPVDDFKEMVYQSDSIAMLVMFFRNPEDLETCRKIFAQEKDILVVQTDPNNFEIVSKKAGKGKALLRLAEKLGIEREETVAVGDSHNDLTMIVEAGLGLAMKNSVPEILEIADEVICDHNDHCVEYILNRYFTKGEK